MLNKKSTGSVIGRFGIITKNIRNIFLFSTARCKRAFYRLVDSITVFFARCKNVFYRLASAITAFFARCERAYCWLVGSVRAFCSNLIAFVRRAEATAGKAALSFLNRCEAIADAIVRRIRAVVSSVIFMIGQVQALFQKKASVVIIEPDGATAKNIKVPSFLFVHWKRIACAVVGVLAVAVFLLFHSLRQQYMQIYGLEIRKLKAENRELEKHEFNNHMTNIEMRKSINSIDSTLVRINEVMKKRGLKEIWPKNMGGIGGPVEMGEEDLVELSLFYEKELKDLEKKLEGMPLGKPHPGRITSRFGFRRNPFTHLERRMHSGVDLKGKIGDPIKVTAKGRVTFSGYNGGYGYVVMVRHGNGFETRYAHLSRPLVKRGQSVDAGEIVGLLGSTGRSTGPHVHYEVLRYGKKLNPEKHFYF